MDWYLKMILSLVGIVVCILIVLYINHLYESHTYYIYNKSSAVNTSIKNLVESMKYSSTIYLPTSWLKIYSWMDRKKDKKIEYKRVIHSYPDGGQAALDHYPVHFDSLESSPILFLFAGLNGDQMDSYVVYSCVKAYELYGYRCIVFNKRGFGGVPLTGKYLLSWPRICDFDEVLKSVISKYPGVPVMTMGFSMGANFTEHYLGEKGKAKEATGLTASVAVSPVHDASLGSHKIDKSRVVRESLVSACITAILKNKHSDTLKTILEEKGLSEKGLRKIKKIRDLDEEFTSKVLGLGSADQYYDSISGIKRLEHIQTHLLSISSENDPLIDHNGLDVEKVENNAMVFYTVVKSGGHIEYCHGLKNDNWAVLVGLKYLRFILDQQRSK